MKIVKFAFCLVICTLGLCLSATAGPPTITTFDAPGAGTGPVQGTLSQGIHSEGAIVGFIRNAGSPSGTARRGFLRAKDGSFTAFDAPGAGTANFQGTRVLFRATQPFVLVPYHGGSPHFKDGLGTFSFGLAFLFIAAVRAASGGGWGWQLWFGGRLAQRG